MKVKSTFEVTEETKAVEVFQNKEISEGGMNERGEGFGSAKTTFLNCSMAVLKYCCSWSQF